MLQLLSKAKEWFLKAKDRIVSYFCTTSDTTDYNEVIVITDEDPSAEIPYTPTLTLIIARVIAFITSIFIVSTFPLLIAVIIEISFVYIAIRWFYNTVIKSAFPKGWSL